MPESETAPVPKPATAPEPVVTAVVSQAAPAAPQSAKAGIKSLHLPSKEALAERAEQIRTAVSKSQAYSKQNLDAVVAAVEAANKGAAALGAQTLSLSQDLIQQSLASAQTLVAAKSLTDFTSAYRDFAKSALETHLTGIDKFAQTVSASFTATLTPLKARMDDTLKVVRKEAA